MSFFPGFTNTQTANTGTGLFGGGGGSANNQSSFSNQQNQAQQANQNFGASAFGAFGNLSTQNQAPQTWQQQGQAPTQQQQQEQAKILNDSSQHLPSFLKSESGAGSRPRDVKDQIDTIFHKWNPQSRDCAFQHYFYNRVPEAQAPFYGPAAHEDPQKWEEALSKKPGPGYIPVLCVGFSGVAERIKTQQRNLAEFNILLHQINDSLDFMLKKHDVETSIRIMEAKRKHIVLKTKCLTLARKVQVMRNRGYALSNEEEAVRQKLTELEKRVTDPGLAARAEEIWARMLGIKSRAEILKEHLNKSSQSGTDATGTDAETLKKANKVLQDYTTQLAYLKKEMVAISEDFKKWLEESGIPEVVLPARETGLGAKESKSAFA